MRTFNPAIFIARSLWHYRRAHAALLACCAAATAIIVGSLAVGSSGQRSILLWRTQSTAHASLALDARTRYFRHALAQEVARRLGGAHTAAVLARMGSAQNDAADARAAQVQVLGVDDAFWPLAALAPPSDDPLGGDGDEAAVAINQRLANQLGLTEGDYLQLILPLPSLMDVGSALSGPPQSLAPRLRVRQIVSDDTGGRFAPLAAPPAGPYNAFVPLAWLQRALGLEGLANLLLVGSGPTKHQAQAALRKAWQPADAQLHRRDLPDGTAEWTTPRVFIDQPIVRAAAAVQGAQAISAYLANEIRLGDRATPYSIVAGHGALTSQPADDQAAIISDWLADDLQAHLGEWLALTYYVADASGRLSERLGRVRIAEILPMSRWPADRSWMPEFPGLSDAESCADWNSGVRIEMSRVRPKDERYWDDYRGTPKLLVSLPTAAGLWGQGVTALRLPAAAGMAFWPDVDPAELGLAFADVRTAAGNEPYTDFAGLFLGLSSLLLAVALILAALVQSLAVQDRRRDLGVLAALGISPRRGRLWMLAELAIVAGAGALAGTGLGVLYTSAMVEGLRTVWGAAMGHMPMRLHAPAGLLATGALAGWVLSLAACAITMRRLAKRQARELLDLTPPEPAPPSAARWTPRAGAAVALAAAVGSGAMAAWAPPVREVMSLGLALGLAVLVGGAVWLAALLGRKLPVRAELAVQRREAAAMVLMAVSAFLLTLVAANRLSPSPHSDDPKGPAGGFTHIGQSLEPLLAGTARAGAGAGAAQDFLSAAQHGAVGLLVRDGESADCLNPARAANPPVWGVERGALAGRFSFSRLPSPAPADPWELLESPQAPIPAIADETTITWSLGTEVGKVITVPGPRGEAVSLKLVAALQGSVLQGGLLISADNFRRSFGATGYRMFLLNASDEAAAEFTRLLADRGLELTPTSRRLAELAGVQNTYIAIFTLLGALAMALGSAGAGLVVVRNVMARRAELAIMQALGFQRKRLRAMIARRQILWVLSGLVLGVFAGTVAALPAGRVAAAPSGLCAALAAVALLAVAWCSLAARWALSGRLIDALRSE